MRSLAPIKKQVDRKAFTLIELLVSITILVILATVTLYGMASVQKTAQIQRAKSQITRINELILDQWESYETRAVDVVAPPHTSLTPADMRLLGIRELMRFELPDRKSDLWPDDPGSFEIDTRLRALETVPSLARYYKRRAPLGTWTTEYEQAECLYLILSRITVGDASALEFFGEEEIGDKDRDGVPEILDPWGHPIYFVRWPAGYSTNSASSSETPLENVSYDPLDYAGREDLNSPGANTGIDPEGVELRRIPHALFPLIVSGGPSPNGELGLRIVLDGDNDYPSTTVMRGSASIPWPNDPYAIFRQGSRSLQVGSIADKEAASESITNHLITTGIR